MPFIHPGQPNVHERNLSESSSPDVAPIHATPDGGARTQSDPQIPVRLGSRGIEVRTMRRLARPRKQASPMIRKRSPSDQSLRGATSVTRAKTITPEAPEKTMT